MFKTIVELQHQFNKQVAEENYLDKDLNWNSAIIAESGELLDSLGYKWWKKQEPNMENVKVEAIDLLHFVISDTLQTNYNYMKFITKIDEDYFINETIEEFRGIFTIDYKTTLGIEDLFFLIDLLNQNPSIKFKIMKDIFSVLNMSNEDVYIAYITKNCLNKFRQDNRYKEGTYQKIWNGKEDNIVAFEIANKLGADENLFEKLYVDLKIYYKEEVLNV